MPTTGFLQPDIETMPRAELESLQLERLQTTADRWRAKVPLMADRLAGIDNPTSGISRFP